MIIDDSHRSLLPIGLLAGLFEGGQIFELLPEAIRDAQRAVPPQPEDILAALNTGAKFGEKRRREAERTPKTGRVPLPPQWASDKSKAALKARYAPPGPEGYAEATNELQR